MDMDNLINKIPLKKLKTLKSKEDKFFNLNALTDHIYILVKPYELYQIKT
jgi:hypothetical protein